MFLLFSGWQTSWTKLNQQKLAEVLKYHFSLAEIPVSNFYPVKIAVSEPVCCANPLQLFARILLKILARAIRKNLENNNMLGTQIKNILKSFWMIPL